MTIAGIVLLLGIIVMVLMTHRKRKLSGAAKKQILGEWKVVASMHDPARQILEADKVLDHLLRELGFTGSVGDMLKAAGPILPDIDQLWDAHRIRNNLAHEIGVTIKEQELSRTMRAYERVVLKFTA